jgi:hypothetical protein
MNIITSHCKTGQYDSAKVMVGGGQLSRCQGLQFGTEKSHVWHPVRKLMVVRQLASHPPTNGRTMAKINCSILMGEKC